MLRQFALLILVLGYLITTQKRNQLNTCLPIRCSSYHPHYRRSGNFEKGISKPKLKGKYKRLLRLRWEKDIFWSNRIWLHKFKLTYLSSSSLFFMLQNWPRPLARGGIDRCALPTLGDISSCKKQRNKDLFFEGKIWLFVVLVQVMDIVKQYNGSVENCRWQPCNKQVSYPGGSINTTESKVMQWTSGSLSTKGQIYHINYITQN